MKHPPRNIAIDWLNTIWKTDLPPNAKYLACYLRKFMNSENDMAWPSIRRIEGETGLSRPTIVKYLKVLEADGWLHIARGDRVNSSTYYATFPEEVVKELNHVGGKGAFTGGKGALPEVVKELYRNKQLEVNKEINKSGRGFVSTRGRTLQDDLTDTSWAE